MSLWGNESKAVFKNSAITAKKGKTASGHNIYRCWLSQHKVAFKGSFESCDTTK